MAVALSVSVGSLLNALNWSNPGTAPDKLVWVLRFGGNYAVPFTVSLSTGLFGSLV